VLIEQNCQCVL